MFNVSSARCPRWPWRSFVVALVVFGGCAPLETHRSASDGHSAREAGKEESRENSRPREAKDEAPSTSSKHSAVLVWPRPAPSTGLASTDRPGFADSTAVMPRGHFQLELGYTVSQDREEKVRTRDHAFPQSNLRIGLLDELELRLLWNGFSLTETKSEGELSHDDGVGDMTLGLRAPLLKNDGISPDLTALFNLSIPVGTPSKSADELVPDLRLAYGWELIASLRLYGVGIASAGYDDEGRFFQGSASSGLSLAITKELSAFIEYFGIYANDRSAPRHSVDGGFAYLLTPSIQLDLSLGFGLNDEATDSFLAAGISLHR